MTKGFSLRPSTQDFVYGPDFAMAPVDYALDSRGGLIVLIDSRVMDRDIYHRLPEHRDWDEIIRGDFAIVGRVQLSPDFLDLVIVSEADGDLRSAFIHRSNTPTKPKEVREFIDRCWKRARIITLQEDRNKRSVKK